MILKKQSKRFDNARKFLLSKVCKPPFSVVEQTLAKLSDVIDSFSTSPQKTRCSFVCSEFEWRRMMTSLVYWLLSQKSIIKTGEGTHFICFTMVLFPDSPAPRKRKKKHDRRLAQCWRRWSLGRVWCHSWLTLSMGRDQVRDCCVQVAKWKSRSWRSLDEIFLAVDNFRSFGSFCFRFLSVEVRANKSRITSWKATSGVRSRSTFFQKTPNKQNRCHVFFCSEDGIFDRKIEPFRSSSRSNFPMLFFETHSIKNLHEHDFWCFCLARWQIG